ncbi:YybH family protein [Pseudothauera lacus]|uniref:DUF4440 domain-containing protein n=1 Tax=Pseudothauera lacus TaxID=2136175 RepID=A0A2T4IEH0_9RHOO|nr:nuclear transport factor 2 family protein [Pseudothauera lacus]PTD96169.1 DUF4440 domain-containing protein [Pseudothauera lacus]
MSKPQFATAADAEAAFYDALVRADLEAMMAVWSAEDDTVCVQPGGPRLTGLAEIREAWRQLFASGTRLIVRTSHQVISANTLQAVHNVLEHVAVEGDDRIHTPIVATNVYARGAGGWHMVMHHASPIPDLTELIGQHAPRVVH